MHKVSPPGSAEAIKDGCLCPQIDNHFGLGWGGLGEKYGWVVTESCPVHRSEEWGAEEESGGWDNG